MEPQRPEEQPEGNQVVNSRLLSLLSHDIRQPLGMLKSMAMLLRNGYELTAEGLMKMIESIENAADLSLHMCDNVLPWIKWQLLTDGYQPVPLSLQPLLDETIQQLVEGSEIRDITIQNKIDAGYTIHADKALLLLLNKILIDHAVSFSNEPIVITITAQTIQEEILINITNQNSRLAAEEINNFFHVHTNQAYTNDTEKNICIAFMVCKSVVAQMYGRIWAEDSKEQGIAFCYALPTGNQPSEIKY